MLEAIKQGVLGFFLFAGNWVIPSGGEAALSLQSIDRTDSLHYRVTARMDLAMSRDLETLVNAGVPLRFRFRAALDAKKELIFYRVLRFDVVSYKYAFSDSSAGEVRRSKTYPMILLALKDFCRIQFNIPHGFQRCRIEAEILSSRVSRLNRSVDMSRIWGQRRIATAFQIQKGREP